MRSQEAYEVIMNQKFYLLSSSRLPDGSTLQFATDIDDTKKQEKELLRLKDGHQMCKWDIGRYIKIQIYMVLLYFKEFLSISWISGLVA